MASMRTRQGQNQPATDLTGKERGAIEESLVDIEDRVRDTEPVCAVLVRMARLALTEPNALQDPDRVLYRSFSSGRGPWGPGRGRAASTGSQEL